MMTLDHMPQRYPIEGTFELTVRCNLHCKMCLFRHDDRENETIISKELKAKDWIDLAKQTAREGTMSLLITGGEPLLRNDFCEIWEGIYKQGFIMTLYTNATLVNDRVMDTLKKFPPHRIGVTIYGSNPDTYERVCGNANAFHQAIKGIHLLQTLPSALELRTTIIKDNFSDLLAIEKLVHDEFGKKYHLIQTRSVTQSVRGACTDVKSCRLSPKDNVELTLQRSKNIIKQYVGDSYDEKYLSLEYNDCAKDVKNQNQISLFGCNAGMSSYTISWDGLLLGCQMMGNFSIPISKIGFQTAWEKFPTIVELPEINEKCRQCQSQDLCNCCYASRYAETGDLGGCPEYVCQDTAIINKLLKGRDENE